MLDASSCAVLPSNERNYDFAQTAFRRRSLRRRGIYSFLKCHEVPLLASPMPVLVTTSCNHSETVAATPVLFELTSFPVMRENRYGYTAYPTSYKWRLFGSLSASVYTTASVHRCAFPPEMRIPNKVRGARLPSRNAEPRGRGRRSRRRRKQARNG